MKTAYELVILTIIESTEKINYDIMQIIFLSKINRGSLAHMIVLCL